MRTKGGRPTLQRRSLHPPPTSLVRASFSQTGQGATSGGGKCRQTKGPTARGGGERSAAHSGGSVKKDLGDLEHQGPDEKARLGARAGKVTHKSCQIPELRSEMLPLGPRTKINTKVEIKGVTGG